ncbi:TonB-dependent receptor [Roseiterribacter gracilis]|uniref:TonB-dependent receptor n=1 Tax=Roseiterribacter gracilis TaxID=2812848 RepID=A0A8S8XC77_9PROT|nr:TonB-dependent receptor [Rhodospirillales bacterium TMPK1]
MSSHPGIRAKRTAGLAAVALTCLPFAALAQTAPAGLEEVLVTAERREQSLQTVPISATVLSTADIARKGVTNIADIQQVAPSVAINTFNRSTFINIRGVGIAQSAPTSNPGVAFYVDGQLLPHEQFIGQSFFDIGSIEVLRGPQGTLTGQNSTGGAIYVRTPKPEYDSFFAYVDQTIGDYNWFKTTAAVNAPINNNIAVRVAGVRDTRDSYTKNIGPSGKQPGNVDLLAGRINIAARSSDDRMTFNIRVETFDGKSDNNPVKRRLDTVSVDPFVIEEDARSFQNQNGTRISGEGRIAVTSGIDLRALVAYQDMNTYDQTDGDRTATAPPRPPASAVGRVSLVSTKFDTKMAELNLLSSQKGPFNWVAGFFYLDEYIDTLSQRDNNNTRDFVSSTSTFQTQAHNITKSGFGQINWFVTQPIEIVAGMRFSQDEQTYNRIIPAGAPPANPADLIAVQRSYKLTGKFGVNYHLDGPLAGTMLYANASQGYKAGGVNLTIGTPNFGPETNRVVEAGFKSTFFDRRLRVNGDIFFSDYKDIQLSSLLGGLPVTQNAAAGKSQGGELEVTGQFGAFGFNAGAGYLHAKFDGSTCITDTNSAGTDPGCPTNLRSVPDGRVLPFSPKWTLNAGIQYDVAINDRLLMTPRLQWSHLSSQVATPFPSLNTNVPGRDVFDAKLVFDYDHRYRFEGFINNLTDRRYIASQIQNSSSADGGIIYGAPRVIGVRGTVNF